MKKINHKNIFVAGFTLIEMLIVIAIVAILASVALINTRGISSSSKDTKRISDLSKIQQTLEVHYIKFGQYPADSTFAAMATTIGLVPNPDDPAADRNYGYSVDPGRQHYILSAQLENRSKILDDANEIDAVTGYTGDAVCTDTVDATHWGYCTGN